MSLGDRLLVLRSNGVPNFVKPSMASQSALARLTRTPRSRRRVWSRESTNSPPRCCTMPSLDLTQAVASTKRSRSRPATRKSMPPTRNWQKSSRDGWRPTQSTSRITSTCSLLSASLSASVTTPRISLRTQSTPSHRWTSATVATCLRATRSMASPSSRVLELRLLGVCPYIISGKIKVRS